MKIAGALVTALILAMTGSTPAAGKLGVIGIKLQALVIFGTLTGLDPPSLRDDECSNELGMSRAEVRKLQRVAFDRIAGSIKTPAPPDSAQKPAAARRCVSAH